MKSKVYAVGMLVAVLTVTVATPLVALAQESAIDTTAFLKMAFSAVKDGNWWVAGAAVLVAVVTLIRVYGKKLHALIPDSNPLDKPFWFLFDTKPGGWLLNFLTAVAGGLGTALLAGEKIDWALLKPIIQISLSGAALWELAKDCYAWATSGKAPPAALPADDKAAANVVANIKPQ